MDTERLFFTCWIRLDGQNLYIIWYTNDPDGPDYFDAVYLKEDGTIPAFRSPEALSNFAARLAMELVPELPNLHDLDSVAEWLRSPSTERIDCKKFLAAWNLFGDVRSGINQRNMDREDRSDVYGTLFGGCNLPSVAQARGHFVPQWQEDDFEKLRAGLEPGFHLFKEKLTILD